MTETSVCRRAGDAKVIFNQAVRDDLIPFNPFDPLKSKPRVPDKDRYYLRMANFDMLMAACPNESWKLLIALCRLAGLAPGRSPGPDMGRRQPAGAAAPRDRLQDGPAAAACPVAAWCGS